MINLTVNKACISVTPGRRGGGKVTRPELSTEVGELFELFSPEP